MNRDPVVSSGELITSEPMTRLHFDLTFGKEEDQYAELTCPVCHKEARDAGAEHPETGPLLVFYRKGVISLACRRHKERGLVAQIKVAQT